MLPFNTGLLVITPSASVYAALLAAMDELGSYDESDQGFLSRYFASGVVRTGGRFHELPRRYNLFGCVQEDEIVDAAVYHETSAFHGGSRHPEFRRFKHSLVMRARAILQGKKAD